MTITLSANVHIEMAVPDVQRAYTLLHGRFGAGRIEQEFVARISLPDFIEIEHVGMGEVVLQFCRPAPRERWPEAARAHVLGADIPHTGYLARRGPCVSNLTFCVDDIANARVLLEREGMLPALLIPMSTPGRERPPGYYFTAMEQLGFDLELTEGVLRSGGGRAPLYPAFAQPRPRFDERLGPLRRLRVAVAEIEKPLAQLARLFGIEATRASVGPVQGEPAMETAELTLGNLPIQYCQPLSREGRLGEFLERHGPGIYSLVFDAPGGAAPAGAEATFDATSLRTRPALGFDIEIEPLHMARDARA